MPVRGAQAGWGGDLPNGRGTIRTYQITPDDAVEG